MDEEKRKKYQLLKAKNKREIEELNLQGNILFNECAILLDEYSMLSLEETKVLFKRMENNFPMTNYGHIDWEKFKEVKEIKHITDIYDMLNGENEYFILWDQQDIPCLSCKLTKILDNIDDVLAVSFDTWLLSKNEKEVMEFRHNGKIFYGKIK